MEPQARETPQAGDNPARTRQAQVLAVTRLQVRHLLEEVERLAPLVPKPRAEWELPRPLAWRRALEAKRAARTPAARPARKRREARATAPGLGVILNQLVVSIAVGVRPSH